MSGFGDLFLLSVLECLELLAVLFDVSLNIAEPATHFESNGLSGGDLDVNSIDVTGLEIACSL